MKKKSPIFGKVFTRQKLKTPTKGPLMEMISDAILDAIDSILPRKKSTIGRPEICPRKMFRAIWYALRTGYQWSMLPSKLGKRSTVHGKYYENPIPYYQGPIKRYIADLETLESHLYNQTKNIEHSL